MSAEDRQIARRVARLRGGRPEGEPGGRNGRRLKELLRLPHPFVAIPIEVMESDAWAALDWHALRFLLLLLVQHTAHAGRENGRLVVTYDLAEGTGIPRRHIARSIRKLEHVGLVQRTAIGCGNRRAGTKAPSRYRVTFLHSVALDMHATNEWRRYGEETARPVDGSVTTKGAHGVHNDAPKQGAHGGHGYLDSRPSVVNARAGRVRRW